MYCATRTLPFSGVWTMDYLLAHRLAVHVGAINPWLFVKCEGTDGCRSVNMQLCLGQYTVNGDSTCILYFVVHHILSPIHVCRWRCSHFIAERVFPCVQNSWFAGSHLSLQVILKLTCTYYWTEEISATKSKSVRWSGINHEKQLLTGIIFGQDVCAEYYMYMSKHSSMIGGPGTVVEINEAKFGKRKYNRGRLKDGKWVIIGGIQNGTEENFLQIAPNRQAGKLIPIILNHVATGSTIHMDEWRSYLQLQHHGYTHETQILFTPFPVLIHKS